MHLFLLALPLHAATLAGVTLPDTTSVGGQPTTLNGLGLREKYFVDVYVGGLYLTHPTKDGAAAIAADEPKRVVMHFVYSKVTRDQMITSFNEDFAHQPGLAAQTANATLMTSWLPELITRGQEVVFDYVPGVGTTMSVAGQTKGTIPGKDFMRLVFGIYLGATPPTAALKAGMLGN